MISLVCTLHQYHSDFGIVYYIIHCHYLDFYSGNYGLKFCQRIVFRAFIYLFIFQSIYFDKNLVCLLVCNILSNLVVNMN